MIKLRKFAQTRGAAIAAIAANLGIGLMLAQSEPTQAQVAMRQTKALGGEITLVYPTDQKASLQRLGSFEIEVALGAPPARLNGHLIVLSHGSGGSSLSDHGLARTLALVGFVVAQPEHAGDNWKDSSATGLESFKRRPLEVSQAIDALAMDPSFASLLKLNKTGVHGMSAGGVSAITLAGGQWSANHLLKHCSEHFEADRNFCLFGSRTEKDVRERTALLKAVSSSNAAISPATDEKPKGAQGKLHAHQDPRVVAASVIVPVAALFDADSLKAIAIPLAITSASADELLRPQFHSGFVLKHCARCTELTRLNGAAHFDTLAPWPESIAKPIAQHMPGGALGKDFDSKQRQLAFDRIAQFFVQNLVKP